MNWCEQTILEAIFILNEHDSVIEAAEEISKDFGQLVTTSSLRHAFRKYGYLSPSNYLRGKNGVVKPLATTLEGIDLDDDVKENEPGDDAQVVTRLWLKTDYDSEEYVFEYGSDTFTITFDDMESILVMYSSVEPGKGMTAETISQHFFLEGRDWADKNFLRWMLQAIGFNKGRFPTPPHKMFENHESIIRDAYTRRDAVTKAKGNASLIRMQQKTIDELRAQVDTLEASISLANLTIDETRVSEVVRLPKGVCGSSVLFIPVTDLHNGKEVRRLPMQREQNRFNKSIFDMRVDVLCDTILSEVGDSNYSPSLVHIGGLGDYFEALLANMRPYQYRDMDNHGADQYLAVKEAWIRIIKTAKDRFPNSEILVTIQGGNHDRLTQDRAAKTEEILAFILTENLKDYFKDDNVDIQFGSNIVSILYENGINHLLMHGHITNLRNEKDYQSFINIHGHPGAKRYVVSMGHFHSTAVLTGFNFRAFKHASLCGNDRYNLENLLLGSDPEVMMVEISSRGEKIFGPYSLKNTMEDEAV